MPPKPAKEVPAEDVEDKEGAETPAADEDENALTADNVTKYQTAAEIANRAITKVIAAAVDGATVIDLCKLGDLTIMEGVKPVFAKKKGVMKGIAFPTCVSTGAIVCHMSPSASDADASKVLKDGDVVRIALGVHVDGYAAQVAHTIVVGASKAKPATGKKADVIQAAYVASEAAIRMLRPGKTNYDVTDVVQKVAMDFGCVPVEGEDYYLPVFLEMEGIDAVCVGMLSAQLKRNDIDGTKQIILNPTDAQRKAVPVSTFAEGEVYTLDMVISTGEGKARPQDTRPSIFKRKDKTMGLKTTSARTALSIIKKDFGLYPFAYRQFADEKTARMGMIECVKYDMVTPLEILYEKEGAEIAHLQVTVLLLPTGPLKITAGAWDAEVIKSELAVKDEAIKELLTQPVRNKKKKKKAGGAADKE
ncbi:Proliferation-associated protein 2G4 [Irineochytrium annulatum]|nr:Proliferation-associated protein 2G4 [Irineochytrium annulatum]